MATRTLTEADDGRDVVLHDHDTATVRLVENASTGYQWTGAAAGPCIVLEDNGSAPAEAPGAAATHTFLVRTATPGTIAESADL
jgi:predicted secreted protein